MAEVFVVEGRLGGEPVLWEALEKSGSQLFSMIYITQPANTHRYKHTDDYSAKITTNTHTHAHCSHLQLSLSVSFTPADVRLEKCLLTFLEWKMQSEFSPTNVL